MKNSKILSTLLIVCLLISVSFCNAFALEASGNSAVNISVDQLNQLKEAGVADVDMTSLRQQIEIYNPTKIQVDNAVQGLINKKDSLSVDQGPVDYQKTEAGDSITPYGVVPYHDPSQDWKTSITPLAVSDFAPLAVSTLSNRINAADQTGVYYVIQSTSGHKEMTSYATLPTLSTVNSIDRPYHMFGFSTSGSYSAYGDIGLVYFPDTKVWKGCYNVVENGTRYERYDISFTGGSNLYFDLMFYNAPDKAVLTIRDATSWGVVATVTYTFVNDCVNSTFSTTQISKQVTLAQHNSGTLNITSGTKMTNSKFSQTYLYTPSTYHSFTSTYCSAAYRQGPTSAAYLKVTPTYTAWTTDNVTISFN